MRVGWKYANFAECLEKVQKSTKIPTAKYKVSGCYPIISQEEEFISGYWDEENDIFKIPHPVVVFGDHTRIVKYIDFDFVVGADGVKILSPKPIICPKYLYHYLKFCNIPSLGYSRHYKLLKELSIPIPPLSEQERIVEELDLLTGIIDKQKAQLKELDTLASSIFYDMFGNPVDNDKGWQTKTMKMVAPMEQYKGNISGKNGKYWLLNLDMIAQQTGEIIEKRFFSKDEIGNSTITFDETNVLYSKLRPYLNKVAIPDDKGYGTSELIPLKPNATILERCFLTHLLRSKPFVKFISGKVAGAKMPRVTMGTFWEFPIILPPLSLQQSFAEKIEAIERQKANIKASIAETQKLFDYTMDKYFG